MRIRHAVTVDSAIKALEEIISRSQEPRNILAEEPVLRLNSYLNWVDAAQTQIRYVFADTEIEDSLLSRGYWHICNVTDIPRTMSRLIKEELVSQAGHVNVFGDRNGRLGEAASRLRSLLAIGSRPGRICVPDTNALLHYTQFDQLDWPRRMGVPLVRLVIPLVVIDEIDSKKYARRGEFMDRARQLLTLIDRFAEHSPDGYAKVREGVTVEVLPDEEGHLRASSNDQEILERCELLNQITGGPVTLITGDSGVRINARARGIEVFKLRHDDLLPRYKTPEAQ